MHFAFFFLLHILPHLDWIRRDTFYLSISLRIQFECGKIRTRNNTVFAYFSRSDHYLLKIEMWNICLYVIYVFTKHAWVKAWKNKKGKTALNAFIKILNKRNCKLNISWVDHEREFYDRFMQKWLVLDI